MGKSRIREHGAGIDFVGYEVEVVFAAEGGYLFQCGRWLHVCQIHIVVHEETMRNEAE